MVFRPEVEPEFFSVVSPGESEREIGNGSERKKGKLGIQGSAYIGPRAEHSRASSRGRRAQRRWCVARMHERRCGVVAREDLAPGWARGKTGGDGRCMGREELPRVQDVAGVA